jgi:hypothetical protein
VTPHRRRLRPASAVLAGLALLGLTGCSSSTASAPKTVITLSNQVTGSLPASTVTLTVGQAFAVRHRSGGQEQQWGQTSAGDAKVLTHSGTAAASPCPTGLMGCAPLTDDLYTARATGTTTVMWSFADVLPCSEPKAAECAPITKTIRVVVR